MEFHMKCQDLETDFNVKFAKKYCPESKNPEQYHEMKKYYILYHNMKLRYSHIDSTVCILAALTDSQHSQKALTCQ